MKKIKVNDLNMDIYLGSVMYVTIDVFRFSKDEDLPCVEVEIEENGEYKFLEEINEEDVIVTHEELKKVALNWIFDNVEVI